MKPTALSTTKAAISELTAATDPLHPTAGSPERVAPSAARLARELAKERQYAMPAPLAVDLDQAPDGSVILVFDYGKDFNKQLQLALERNRGRGLTVLYGRPSREGGMHHDDGYAIVSCERVQAERAEAAKLRNLNRWSGQLVRKGQAKTLAHTGSHLGPVHFVELDSTLLDVHYRLACASDRRGFAERSAASRPPSESGPADALDCDRAEQPTE